MKALHPGRYGIKVVSAVSLFTTFVALGTVIFHYVEGWSTVDSFYFTSITMLTIGYGDFVPTTDFSKVLTVVFSLAGVSIALYTMFTVGEHYISRRSEAYYNRISMRMKQMSELQENAIRKLRAAKNQDNGRK